MPLRDWSCDVMEVEGGGGLCEILKGSGEGEWRRGGGGGGGLNGI